MQGKIIVLLSKIDFSSRRTFQFFANSATYHLRPQSLNGWLSADGLPAILFLEFGVHLSSSSHWQVRCIAMKSVHFVAPLVVGHVPPTVANLKASPN